MSAKIDFFFNIHIITSNNNDYPLLIIINNRSKAMKFKKMKVYLQI